MQNCAANAGVDCSAPIMKINKLIGVFQAQLYPDYLAKVHYLGGKVEIWPYGVLIAHPVHRKAKSRLSRPDKSGHYNLIPIFRLTRHESPLQ
jgi:hypothetical protein